MTPSAPWEHTLDPALTARGPVPFRRYLFWFLLLPAIVYIGAFFLIRSMAYGSWRASQWAPMLEFSYAPGPRSADVVIFGDSSAFIGIDPFAIQHQLPLTAVLLPNTIGSLPITHDIALRRYLEGHRPPKLLVFYFSAWDLDYDHAGEVRLFEGEEMMLRHGSSSEIAGFIAHHPAEFVSFPFRFYNTYGAGILKSLLPGRQHTPASVDDALGHLEDHEPFPQLASTCQIPARLMQDGNQSSVASLARGYSRHFQVMVYIAPIPGCTNSATVLQRGFGGIPAAAPVVLPATSFVGDLYYSHMEPFAVPAATRLLTKAIGSRLALQTAPAER